MSFKNLNLNQDKIDDAIQKWASNQEKIEPIKKGNGYHYSLLKENKELLIIIYYNKDGTCTISAKSGKNPDLSEELAEFIKERCLITKRTNFSLTFKDVKTDDFSLLNEFLIDEKGSKVLEEQEHEGRRVLHFKGPHKDEITITYYGNQTVLVQGKPLHLYVEIKLFFYEILSFERVVETEAKTYEIDIKAEQIRSELEAFLPAAFSFLSERIIKIITPSLTLMKLEIELEDYSSFAFPVFRGIEGYIRQLLQHKGNENYVKNVGKIGSLFEEDGNNYSSLQNFAKSDIQCDKTCQALEKVYNFWKKRRHAFFHINAQIQMSPIIWNKKQAESLLNEALNLIENTYLQIYPA